MSNDGSVEAALREAERRASFLAEASRLLASSLDYEETLRTIAHLAVPTMADWCAVDLVDDSGSVNRVAVAHPDPARVAFVESLAEKYPPDPNASHGIAHVIRTGRSEFVPEIPEDLLSSVAVDAEHLRLLRELQLRSYIVAPLLAREHVLGALVFAFAESERRYVESDLSLAEDLARRAAIAIENSRLLSDVDAARKQAEDQAIEIELQATEMEQQAAELEEKARELERINQELGGSRALLQATLDSSLDAVVTIDTESTVVQWSRQAEALFGWSASEAIGMKLTDTIIPPRYREAHRRGIERYLVSGEGRILDRRIEVEARRRDGSEFSIELTVAPARSGAETIFSAFIRDLTNWKRLESHRSAEHAVTRVLATSHSIEEAAPRVLEALGRSLSWDLGGFWVVDPDENVLRPISIWSRPGVEAGGLVEATRTSVFRRGEGLPGRAWAQRSPSWIADLSRDDNFPRADWAVPEGIRSAVAFPVFSGNEILGVIELFHRQSRQPDVDLIRTLDAISSDVAQAIKRIEAESERDRVLRELETINEHLRATNTELAERTSEAEAANRAKSDFLANMSHEFRTPINAIVGYTDLLGMGVAGTVTDRQLAQLDRIKASSQHLLGLVEEVLDLAKIESGRIEVVRRPARVMEPLEEALALVEPQAAAAGLELVSRCEEGREDVFVGDEDRVRQIIANLLSNAVKFTPEGGRITASCGRRERVSEGSRPDNTPWIAIEIEDTGIGIPDDQLESIFEPFVQVDSGRTRTQGGTGLGLAISRRLARLMGGDLTVQSQIGRGSSFTLWLPPASSTTAPADLSVQADLSDLTGREGQFARIGERMQARIDDILRTVNARLRTDPLLAGMASGLVEPELVDHQPALLMDIAQSFIVLGQTGGDPELMRDGFDIRQLISARHGALRARQGWTDEALRREFEILREEVEAVVGGSGSPTPELESARAVLERVVSAAEEAAVLRLRDSLRGEPA